MSDDEMEGALPEGGVAAGRAGWGRVLAPPIKKSKKTPPPFQCPLQAPPLSPPHVPSPHPPLTDYGFAYSDDEVAEEDADIENAYYSAKGALEDGGGGEAGARAALAGFQEVLAMEAGARGDWGFKALKQVRAGRGRWAGVGRGAGKGGAARHVERGGTRARAARPPRPALSPPAPLFFSLFLRSSSSATAWARRTR